MEKSITINHADYELEIVVEKWDSEESTGLHEGYEIYKVFYDGKDITPLFWNDMLNDDKLNKLIENELYK